MSRRGPMIRLQAVTLDASGQVIEFLEEEKLVRSKGITLHTISKTLGGRAVKQVLEYLDDEQKQLCPFDPSNLPAIGDATYPPLVLVEVGETEEREAGNLDTNEAKIAAVLCAAVYDDDPWLFIQAHIQNNPALNIKRECLFLSKHGPITFIIATVAGVYYVAFRGTMSLDDWKMNFSLVPSVQCCGGFLHQGFSTLSQNFPHEVIGVWLQQRKKIILTGHSLGGALAGAICLRVLLQADHAYLRRSGNLQTIMFGAPFFATGGVQRSMDAFRLSNVFHSYVYAADPVPRLLNMTADSNIFQSISNAIQRGLNTVLLNTLPIPCELDYRMPEYAPLGQYHLISVNKGIGINTEVVNVEHFSHSKAPEVLGQPKIGGDGGAETLAHHSMQISYLNMVCALSPHSLRDPGVMKSCLCLGIPQTIPFPDATYKVKEADCWTDASLQWIHREISHDHNDSITASWWESVATLHHPRNGTVTKTYQSSELEFEKNLRYAWPKSFGDIDLVFVRETIQQGGRLSGVQVTIRGTAFGEYSVCWICDVLIDGFELVEKQLKRYMLDNDKLQAKVHVTYKIRNPPHRSPLIKEMPVHVKCVHLLWGELSTERGHFSMTQNPRCLDGLSPYESLLDTESPLLLKLALNRVVLEVFLGEISSWPIEDRLTKIQEIPLVKKLFQLEQLTCDQNNIQAFMTSQVEELTDHDKNHDIEKVSGSLCELLRTVEDSTSDQLWKIVDFVFSGKQLSRAWTNAEIAFATLGGVVAGACMVAGGWAIMSYAGASALLTTGRMVATMATGAVASGVVAYQMASLEPLVDSYQRVLGSYIVNLGGRPSAVPGTCFHMEQLLEQLVVQRMEKLALEKKIEEYTLKLYADRSFAMKSDLYFSSHTPLARGNAQVISPRDIQNVWVDPSDITDRDESCPICHTVQSSRELAVRHLFIIQLMSDIRKMIVSNVWIAVVGTQNAGKSSFIKALWPRAEVKGMGGGDRHTVLPNPCRISPEVMVVDFPGIDDWDNISFVTNSFIDIATLVVVVIKAEHVAEHEINFVQSVKHRFTEARMVVCANQIDRFPEQVQSPKMVQTLIDTYASADRLDVDRKILHLTSMHAFDINGDDSTDMLQNLVQRGVKGPQQIRRELESRLDAIQRKAVSLHDASPVQI